MKRAQSKIGTSLSCAASRIADTHIDDVIFHVGLPQS